MATVLNDTNRILVLDGTNLAYMSYFSETGLSFKGEPTAVIFGVLNHIRSLSYRLHSYRTLICWDGHKHPVRMDTLPTYKSHRAGKLTKEERDSINFQIDVVKEMLYYLGFTQYYHPAIEGDDMVYMVTRRMLRLDPNNRVVIVSMDKDFHQLIDRRVSTYNPKIHGIFTPELISIKCFGLKHFQVMDYYMFLGDTSDDIPGYPGIGEVKASKFLKQFTSIEKFLANPKWTFPGIDRDKLKEFYKTTRLMRDLEYFYRKVLKPDGHKAYRFRGKTPTQNLPRYERLCRRYGMQSLITPKAIEIFNNYL